MKINEIIEMRLQNQLISTDRFEEVHQVVSRLGAMQAQDFAGAKWSIGLRIPGLKDIEVEKAIAAKSIIRTWPMRGTLHFVAAEDARWMLKLLTPRVIASSAGRHRELLLDDKVFHQSRELIVPALEGGKQLTRTEVFEILGNHGIETANQRGMHIIGWLAQNQVICHGSHNEKQPTYALMDEWVAQANELSEDEALMKLALRYFTSHGPATAKDLAWWAGLKISDTKKAIELAGKEVATLLCEGITYYVSAESAESKGKDNVFMLPGFDEYMLGYTNRSLILQDTYAQKIVPGNNGMFMPTMILKGKVEGTWKRTFRKDKVVIDYFPFSKLTDGRKKAFKVQARKFAKYLNKEIDALHWH